jgi:4'-phosphopantetheinyl transferase
MRKLPSYQHVHVWLFSIDPKDYRENEFLSILSPEEQAKSKKFHFSVDQKKYVISHGIMRKIIASYIPCHPKEIQYRHNAYGKPELHMPSCDIHFNLSHSEKLGALAIATRPIGTDIEHLKPLEDYISLTKHFLSEKESNYFEQLTFANQHQAFYRAWTKKEAYIKAIGMGLSYPVEQITICLDEHPQILEDRVNPDNAANLSIVSFEHEDYMGAIAIPKNYTIEIKKISLPI